MQKYEFLEHTADATLKAYGRDLNELFENAAEAFESTMVFLDEVALGDICTIEDSFRLLRELALRLACGASDHV